jgi:hypothetical protein
MLTMCIHSHNNADKEYEVIMYRERIEFLPQKGTTPTLTLLVGHFIPLKYLKGPLKDSTLDFPLNSLIEFCRWKLNKMINILDLKAHVVGKRPRCPEIGELNHHQPPKRVKLDDLTVTTNPSG